MWQPWGESTTIAVFVVTTDSPPGVAAGCYEPEPWACLLEKTAADYRPIDCVRR